jgi:hypothetical protein
MNNVVVEEVGPSSDSSTTRTVLTAKAIVRKSAETRHWLVQFGEQFADFGPGAAGQAKAYQMFVTVERPDVASLVIDLMKNFDVEGLEVRAWRGGKIAIEGGVTLAAPGLMTVAAVKSSGTKGPDSYLIQKQHHMFTCTCPDFQFSGAPRVRLASGNEQLLCKHLIAFSIASKSGDAVKQELEPVTASRGQGSRKTINTKSVPADDDHLYATGEPVKDEHLSIFKAFVDAMRTQPFNEEKLISWTYR